MSSTLRNTAAASRCVTLFSQPSPSNHRRECGRKAINNLMIIDFGCGLFGVSPAGMSCLDCLDNDFDFSALGCPRSAGAYPYLPISINSRKGDAVLISFPGQHLSVLPPLIADLVVRPTDVSWTPSPSPPPTLAQVHAASIGQPTVTATWPALDAAGRVFSPVHKSVSLPYFFPTSPNK